MMDWSEEVSSVHFLGSSLLEPELDFNTSPSSTYDSPIQGADFLSDCSSPLPPLSPFEYSDCDALNDNSGVSFLEDKHPADQQQREHTSAADSKVPEFVLEEQDLQQQPKEQQPPQPQSHQQQHTHMELRVKREKAQKQVDSSSSSTPSPSPSPQEAKQQTRQSTRAAAAKARSSVAASVSSETTREVRRTESLRARNRESASRYRDRKRAQRKKMDDQLNQLNSEVSQKSAMVAALTHENQALKSQLSFFQSLFARAGSFIGVSNPAASAATPSATSTTLPQDPAALASAATAAAALLVSAAPNQTPSSSSTPAHTFTPIAPHPSAAAKHNVSPIMLFGLFAFMLLALPFSFSPELQGALSGQTADSHMWPAPGQSAQVATANQNAAGQPQPGPVFRSRWLLNCSSEKATAIAEAQRAESEQMKQAETTAAAATDGMEVDGEAATATTVSTPTTVNDTQTQATTDEATVSSAVGLGREVRAAIKTFSDMLSRLQVKGKKGSFDFASFSTHVTSSESADEQQSTTEHADRDRIMPLLVEGWRRLTEGEGLAGLGEDIAM